MPARNTFDYAIVRVVPRVERGEFINAGIILFCLTQRFLSAKVELDEKRLVALAPEVDVAVVRGHLEAIPRICAGGKAAGPIGQLPVKERWHWLVAPRSTILQTSPVHSGLCEEPARALEQLMDQMVRLRPLAPLPGH
ncbi:DUF3037 domain-containing protein [Hyalangium rubrum]|uniref:DUF3037 domain-containing protein n=1 Tax=Hyalangium rubrum TaxID=3103134 RepID=A0ABU5GZI2_9BACT|nr:DUF3037 domain-containing protein [Hyalangium sp. s54d21]MDY7226109.1 DUF3037 domain-containing protein [Hyalangium sp. s54d21]